MAGIFISYRREDARGFAGRLADNLGDHFGPSRVFRDVEDLQPGVDYVTQIELLIESCDILLVLIGRDWLTIADERGQPRLVDPMDEHRIEIVTAFKNGVRVIPVLLDGGRMPRVQDLPAELAPLARRQAYDISDGRWHDDVRRLVRLLEAELERCEQARQAANTAAHETPPPTEPSRPPADPAARAATIRLIWLFGAGISEAGFVVDRWAPGTLHFSIPWFIGATVATFATALTLTGTWRYWRRAAQAAVVSGVIALAIDGVIWSKLRYPYRETLTRVGGAIGFQSGPDDALMLINAALCALVGVVLAVYVGGRWRPLDSTPGLMAIIGSAKIGAALGVVIQLVLEYFVRWPDQNWPAWLRFGAWIVVGAVLIWRRLPRASSVSEPPPPAAPAPHPV
jgi:hypothetical protein